MLQTHTQTQTQTQTQPIKQLVLIIQDELICQPCNMLKKVTWHESVIDNEHMNKRKSNKCCIFHKRQEWYDNSSDSDSDSE